MHHFPFFKKYKGLYFLLHCNFYQKLLKSVEMPSFYKQILGCFLELKCIYNTNEYHELILFNKDILIGGKPVFYRDWFEKGVKDPVLSIMHCALQKSAAIFLMLKNPVGLIARCKLLASAMSVV